MSRRLFHELPGHLWRDETRLNKYVRMTQGRCHFICKFPLGTLGVVMSPGKCTSNRHKRAVNRGDILCMMEDNIQLGHSKHVPIFKVCAYVTHGRQSSYNHCPRHKDLAPYGFMLDVDQAREATGGLLQANTAQEKRQKEVNEESKPWREGRSNWRSRTEAPDWDTMNGDHSTG